MRIAVLLCVYNGARFLREQLDSLLSQSLKDFIVYLHDDGSSDETVSILSEYVGKWPERFILLDDTLKHRGASASFMWLFSEVEADYYFFCDQDDIWLPFKMQHTLDRMRAVEMEHLGIPVLIHTDLLLCDGDGISLGTSFWQHQHFLVDISKQKEYLAFGNVVTGCTAMVNEALKRVAFPYDGTTMHDYWLAMKAARHGVVENLKEQTVHYRLHGGNAAGAGSRYDRRRILWKRFWPQVKTELTRFRALTGKGVPAWLFYRTRYFILRHLA